LLNPLQFSPVDEAEQFDVSTPRLEMTVEARQANLHLAKAAALGAAHELAELERHENERQLQQEALAPGRDDVEMAWQMAATLKGTTIDDDSDADLADDPSLGQTDQGSESKPRNRRDMKETPGPWPRQPGVSSVSGGPEAAAPEDIPAAQPSVGPLGAATPTGPITSSVHNGVTAVGIVGAVELNENSMRQMAMLCKDMVAECFTH
jgi:hypothetical protein